MPVSQLISIEHRGYEYHNSEASCAHDYLLSTVSREIGALGRGKSLKVLDLGCGNGYVAAQVAARGHTVSAVDVSSDGIAIARASFHLFPIIQSPFMTMICSTKLAGLSTAPSPSKLSNTCFSLKLFEQSHRLLVDEEP